MWPRRSACVARAASGRLSLVVPLFNEEDNVAAPVLWRMLGGWLGAWTGYALYAPAARWPEAGQLPGVAIYLRHLALIRGAPTGTRTAPAPDT
ncbi:MAG TPA: hypothetical protein VFS02_21120 [Telluria sp.]|nr:hypothetical protein [Telluria sp.]